MTEISLIVGLLVVLSFVFRNLIQLFIPFPFDKMHGFDIEKVKEYKSQAFLNIGLLLYNTTLTNKVVILKNKFSKSETDITQ